MEGGVVLDGSIFYPKGGGQPGDSGHLRWDTQTMSIATAIKGDGDQIVLIPAEPQALPPVGAILVQELDWERRHKHMRVHTALHLLSVAVPFGVTGGSIGAGQGRLDFDMPEIPENREIIEQALQAFVEMDVVVAEEWIDQATLDASPELVKTVAVKPPRGVGQVRLVRIGRGNDQIDLQPCGGTHVARTGEIGALRLGKIEKKGRMNRRIYLHLDD
jgi:Ser-tRNA(Ala) deacylase AlaX